MPSPFADLGPAILDAFGEPVTLVRHAPGDYDQATGNYAQGSGTETTLEAAVQPATPDELQELPEGEQTSEAITLYAAAPLFTSDRALEREADIVTWQGRNWKVVKTDPWQSAAGYTRAIATRIGG